MTNSITLVGRATDAPTTRYYESGTIRTTFTLAVNRRTAADDPDLFPLEIWGKNAQLAADEVRKGTLIGIIGSIHRQWPADPEDRTATADVMVRVDRLELLGPARPLESSAL